MNTKDFITPKDHVHFLAKKLFDQCGEIQNGSIAYIEPQGGGPAAPHTHPHNHLFIVIKGCATILLGDQEVLVHKNESFLVKGVIPHSVWNHTDQTTIMLGITVL